MRPHPLEPPNPWRQAVAAYLTLAASATWMLFVPNVIAAIGCAIGVLLLVGAPSSSRLHGRALVLGTESSFLDRMGTWLAAAGIEVESKQLADGADLERVLARRGVTPIAVVVIEDALCHPMRDIVRFAAAHGARLLVVPPAPRESGARGRALAAAEHPLEYPLTRWEQTSKRALDLVIAATGLVVTLPLLLVAMALIRLESPGAAVFRQTRLGVDGRRFTMLKLRTMRIDGDDAAHRAYVEALIRGEGVRQDGIYKLTRDPRVTKVGRVLRQFSLDELPQLVNVIRGEMSVVGPRPPLVDEVELYDARAWQRLRVKPGLTGLWQVSGRSELSFPEMIELDIRYWQEWSFASDLVILLRSPLVVLFSRTA